MQNRITSGAGISSKVYEGQTSTLDILLIPPITNPIFTKDFEQFMPLGLLSLSSNLRNNKFSGIIYQPQRRAFKKEELLAIAKEILHYSPRIVGFSTWCSTFPTTLAIAKALKSLDPEITILFGGPHASLLHRDVLKKFLFVDFVLRGESDRSLIILLDVYLIGKYGGKLEKVPGLTFRSGGRIISNDDAPLVKDLDDLPIPAYDTISLPKHVKLDVGRGCPFRCTYCSTSDYFSKKYRVKSAERIIDEMNLCYELAKTTHFGLAHDMFPLRESYILDFCKKLIHENREKKLSYNWTCSARTDCLTEKMLHAMKQSGCTDIFVGVETGSPRMQGVIKKNLDLTYTKKIIKKGIALGIRMTVSFMAGFPSETRHDLEKTLKYVLEVAASGAKVQMSLLSVLPGTPLYKKNKKKLKYDGYFSDFSHSIFGQEELNMIEGDCDLFSSFYYLPVPGINRETFIMVSELVNQIRIFPKTLALIWNEIKDDLSKLELLDHIECRMVQQKKRDKKEYCELTFLIEYLQEILPNIQLDGKSQLVQDVFLFESSKYLILRNFTRKQLIEPRQKFRKDKPISQESAVYLNPLPFWTIIKTSFFISQILNLLPGKEILISELDKGKYRYLLVANAENNVKWFPIRKKHVEFLDYIAKMKSIKLFEMEQLYTTFRLPAKWLKELIDLEVIKIV